MNLYLRKQVYQLDRLAMDLDGQPSEQLMLKAASAVWKNIQLRWPDIRHIVVFAGPGNNGGDAFALACLAQQSAVDVDLISLGDLSSQSEASAFYRTQWENDGGVITPWTGRCPDCDLIVDGLLGIGLNKMLDEQWQALVRIINSQPVIRVCIDIPSGLDADTGNPLPCAVQADLTVTFIGRKVGCFIAYGPDYCGELLFDDLGLSQSSLRRIQPVCRSLDRQQAVLPPLRKNNSHKNQFGHVLIIGGDRGMSGAVRLAGMAALRSGAGLVSLCVHPDNYAVAAGQHAELMVSDWRDLNRLVDMASVIVVGPGLGQSGQAEKLLQTLSHAEKPMVVDADALRVSFLASIRSKTVVLTPHPGEAARLLDTAISHIQRDRLDALKRLNDQWPYVAVLKGAGTMIAQHNEPLTLCCHGHAGMATAGMGDVLAGLTGGYLAQGLSALQAAQAAVLVHALAAEQYAQTQDDCSLISSDVIDGIGSVVRQLRSNQNLS